MVSPLGGALEKRKAELRKISYHVLAVGSLIFYLIG